MDEPRDPKWKKVLAWVVMVWAVGVFAHMLTSHPDPDATQMYMYGQWFGVLLAFLAGCWSIHYLFMRRL